VPNLVAWAAFILFAAVATFAAWPRRTNDQPASHHLARNRLSHNVFHDMRIPMPR
jgi:hypothetical protein